ncbi:MAG: 3,4-dihydroxy-2-butanone-4-phosphate synthase [Bdellovibrionales bacterium]|nr:3,4-dihydroxy-2-butanone-4-phosphate synthase [Bdellovibrionales bacterium]
MKLNNISELIEDIRAGKMVILVDDENRENEGDLILSADYVTPASINFMASEARGLICVALTGEQIQRLRLPLMVKEGVNLSPNRTAFTLSVEAARGVTTGISAADRAHTIKVVSSPSALPEDVIVPGHIFPICAQEGGVLKRAGHTEASVDLVRLAGHNPAATICEIMNSDGTMARLPELIQFAHRHGIKIGTIESLITYRIQNETFVEEIVSAQFPTTMGEGFQVRVFHNKLDGRDHLAFVKGDVRSDQPILVRVHTECVMGDVFQSLRTQSGEYLTAAMTEISREGRGVLLYLRNEDMAGRLRDRVKAYKYMDQGHRATDQLRESFHTDDRDYGVGAQILRSLGLNKICLLTNSPAKKVGLKGYGLEIVESRSLSIDVDPLRSDWNQ